MTVTEFPGGDQARRPASGTDLPRLTPAEDAELRQLAWFAKAGQLSEQSQARMSELRARDRRDAIRDPHQDSGGGCFGYAPRFGSEPSGSHTACPNCGSGSLKPVGSSRTCSYCGFTQRGGTAPAEPPATAGDLARVEKEGPALGTIDKGAFREMLLSAATGGVGARGRTA